MNEITKRLPLLALALLILCAGAVSCALVESLETAVERPWRLPRPVRIEGPGLEQAANLSLIPWVAETEAGTPTAVLLRGGDPLFVAFSGTEEAWLPYHRRDGTCLEVTLDTYFQIWEAFNDGLARPYHS